MCNQSILQRIISSDAQVLLPPSFGAVGHAWVQRPRTVELRLKFNNHIEKSVTKLIFVASFPKTLSEQAHHKDCLLNKNKLTNLKQSAPTGRVPTR